jgi:phosphoribosylanthranilate isomerase
MAMDLLAAFLDPDSVSLKICGVTLAADAARLVEMGVPALGANFWSGSKRYLAPDHAEFLDELEGEILRVGVFVNQDTDHIIGLFERGWIDAAQLHGDETPEDSARLTKKGIPVIKAMGFRCADDVEGYQDYHASALLLDVHAPGVFGGTGRKIDWQEAAAFRSANPVTPLIIAGGIVPQNAAEAAAVIRPCALDVASGAERSPGIKDFEKVAALMDAIKPQD